MMIPDCHRRIVAAHAELKQLLDTEVNRFSYLRHLFEYIGTQFPPPSSLLYGKMGSITLFFFQMGILNMIQHFMHKY
jgi:hypothetical protein